jgi:hypothetical protein
MIRARLDFSQPTHWRSTPTLGGGTFYRCLPSSTVGVRRKRERTGDLVLVGPTLKGGEDGLVDARLEATVILAEEDET